MSDFEQFWAGATPKWVNEVSAKEFIDTVLPDHVEKFFAGTGKAFSTDVLNEVIGGRGADVEACFDDKKLWPSPGPFVHDISWAVQLVKLTKATGKGGILMINDVSHIELGFEGRG